MNVFGHVPYCNQCTEHPFAAGLTQERAETPDIDYNQIGKYPDMNQIWVSFPTPLLRFEPPSNDSRRVGSAPTHATMKGPAYLALRLLGLSCGDDWFQ